jgi:hypothetical protein
VTRYPCYCGDDPRCDDPTACDRPADPAALLDQLDALHDDATNPAPYFIDPKHAQDVLNRQGSSIAETAWPEDAVLIVAAVNALPQLTAALRAALALADQFSEQADLNEERADQHHRRGRIEDYEYRIGRSVSYRQCATKLGEAITAVLGGTA